MNRDDFIDKIIGGTFALIAIVASLLELILGGISATSITACVKDVFGTLAVVVLFFAIIKDKIPSRNFKKAFDSAMIETSKKYSPLIRKEEVSLADDKEETATMHAKKKKLNTVICYDMAANLNVLFGVSCNDYPRFLEIHNGDTTCVKLLIRKKFFAYADFDETSLSAIANKITNNLSVKFCEYSFRVDEKKHEIYINVNRQMKTNKDALELAHLVDNVVMLYIAESKK